MFVFAIGSCLLRMANTIIMNFTHVVKNGSHLIIDEIQEITGSLTQEIFSWLVHGMGASVLCAIWCSKCIVEDIVLYVVHSSHVILIVIASNTGFHRKHSRLLNRCLGKSKDLIPTCLNKACVHGHFQLRSEHTWKPESYGLNLSLDQAKCAQMWRLNVMSN